MTQHPNPHALTVAFAAGRKAIVDYSAFDSGFIPDDLLQSVVTQVVTAYVNALPAPTPPPQPKPQGS